MECGWRKHSLYGGLYVVELIMIPLAPYALVVFAGGVLTTLTVIGYRSEIRAFFKSAMTLLKVQPKETHVHHHYHYDRKKGVVYFGTKFGTFSVRMVQNDDTCDDIINWLRKNELLEPVDADVVKGVFRRRT